MFKGSSFLLNLFNKLSKIVIHAKNLYSFLFVMIAMWNIKNLSLQVFVFNCSRQFILKFSLTNLCSFDLLCTCGQEGKMAWAPLDSMERCAAVEWLLSFLELYEFLNVVKNFMKLQQLFYSWNFTIIVFCEHYRRLYWIYFLARE